MIQVAASGDQNRAIYPAVGAGVTFMYRVFSLLRMGGGGYDNTPRNRPEPRRQDACERFHMTEDPFSDASPWGRCRPSGPGGFWLRAARALPAGWPWSRFALLARRLARRSLRGPVDTRLWGLRLRLHPDRSVSEARILFLPRSWDRVERGLLREWIEPGFTFVDVGANAGAYSFWVLSLAGKGGRVVAVEPDPALARQLRYNVRVNGAGKRMRVVEAAVSASRGEGTLLLASDNSGENRLAGEGEGPPIAENAPVAEGGGTGDAVGPGSAGSARNATVPVRVRTLADLVADAGLDRIDCLKVDVEGREGDVIRPYLAGARRSRWPRRMIVELAYRPGVRGDDQEELKSWIVARGYRLVRRTKLNGVFTLA